MDCQHFASVGDGSQTAPLPYCVPTRITSLQVHADAGFLHSKFDCPTIDFVAVVPTSTDLIIVDTFPTTNSLSSSLVEMLHRSYLHCRTSAQSVRPLRRSVHHLHETES